MYLYNLTQSDYGLMTEDRQTTLLLHPEFYTQEQFESLVHQVRATLPVPEGEPWASSVYPALVQALVERYGFATPAVVAEVVLPMYERLPAH